MKILLLKRIAKVLPALTLLAGLALSSSPARAANAADFNPGRIIDDAVFYDKSAMSVTDIQNWLNDMLDGNPNNGVNKQCDTNGTQPISSGSSTTRAQWAVANGYPAPPYVCIRDYMENPSTKDNNFDGSVSGGLSAAQIIWNESQTYNINPRVLLVLIQKESVGGVLTDDWPWESQYKTIAGYGCPDGAPCASEYFGFYNQMHNAARQFRLYANNPGNYNYIAGMNNNIKYHPSNPCGTQTVFIQNTATAGLYNYTPYVPNVAALNNLYGSGDSCSSYGNRNFWRFWTDWFGTTYVPTYNWSFITQSSNRDLSTLPMGEKATLTLTAKNTGSATWRASGVNPTRLGTYRNQDRQSAFYDPSWITPTRAATVNQDVAPGETGTFTFTIQAPGPGVYKEYFNVLVEGQSWFNDLGQHYPITVSSNTYNGTVLASTFPSTMYPDNKFQGTITVRNDGPGTWYRDGRSPVRVGTATPRDRTSKFYDSTWIQPTRAGVLSESTVAPGQEGHFTFTISSPATTGTFNESFSLVVEGLSWFYQPTFNISVTTNNTYGWQFVSQAAYADGSKQAPADLSQLSAGQYIWLVLKAKNTGTATWTRGGANEVRLGTEGPKDRVSRFNTPGWINTSRPSTFTEASVAPNATGTFEFPIQVPAGGFTGFERFNLVVEDTTWMTDQGVSFYMNVNSRYSWSYWSQFAYTDSNRTTPVDLNHLTPGQRFYYGVIIKNTGDTTWYNCNYYRATHDTNSGLPVNDTDCTSTSATTAANRIYPVRLGTSQPLDHTSGANYMGDASWVTASRPAQLLNTIVQPGQLTSFEMYVTVPQSVGLHREYFQPIAELITWMNDLGLHIPANVIQ